MALAAPLRRLDSEGGFTLIELMVTVVLTMVIFLAASGFWVIADDNQRDTGDRVETLAEQRIALERMTRELRQAQDVSVANAGTTVDLGIPVPQASPSPPLLKPIRYDCSQLSECRRYEGPAGGALDLTTTNAVATGVLTDAATPEIAGDVPPIFSLQRLDATTPATSYDYLGIDLRLELPDPIRAPVRERQPIALTDGVHLRNPTDF